MSPSNKLTRLAKVKDEVRELHPLLNKLLRKLPNVIDVEYTHGNREMGADFVLSKRHDTFGYTEYVGVVAKVGRITQDYADIEKQIEECEVPRNFLAGKEKIRIGEVWVMVTETISNNAQDKIHEKYRLRKVSFIDGSRLEKLIDSNLPSFWTDISLEVGDYLSTLRTKTQDLDASISLLPIAEKGFYVEQDIYEAKKANYKAMAHKQKPAQKVDIHKEIERHKVVLVEGGMGLGKSKLIRRLVEHYTTPQTYIESKILPVHTSYKDLIDEFGNDINKLITTRVGKQVTEEIPDATYLLLIDGVDEKNLTPEEQAKFLSELINSIEVSPNVRAVITSRHVKALEQPSLLAPASNRYEIYPLSVAKTIEFLRTLCTKLNLAARIIEDLKKSRLFKELPRSPIAAILLARLISENSKELPSNLTELYSKYLELVLGRWEMNKGLQSQKEYQALENIMMDLAKHMIDHELPFVSIEDAKAMFRSYLESRNLNIEPDELFHKMLDRCEVLMTDFSGNTLFFKHRTFAEFFYAKSLIRDNTLRIDERVFQLYWMNTFFFYLGIRRDCPEVLRQILKIKPPAEPARWLKVLNISNYLLAAYTSPYEVISEGLTQLMLEAAELYEDIVSRKVQSPFGGLPRMYILFILQWLIRESYSYEFFKPAIEEAALRIDQGTHSDNTKMYALFFLSVTALELGNNEAFEFLLKCHLGKLPLDLAMALRCEEKDLKVRSALLKKQDKHIKKMLQGSRSLTAHIKDLFEKPIQPISSGKSLITR